MKAFRNKAFSVSYMSLIVVFVLAGFIFSVVAAKTQLGGTPLTTDAANDLRPAWSPDGSQIAFFSLRTGNYDIWVMNADGSNQHPLTDDAADDRRPAWSPDGSLIAFDSDRAGTKDIWVMDTEGGNLKQLTDTSADDSFPSWSPDGKKIAFYSYEGGKMDIWSVSVGEVLQSGVPGQPRRVTTGLADEAQNGCTYGCHTPSWSPDGNQIAYDGNNHTEIWVIGVDGSNPHQVSNGGDVEHYPWWTPDGGIILLSEHLNGHDEIVNDVWLIDEDGSNASLLFKDIPHGGPLYWSPFDRATIAFHSPRAGNFDIYSTILGEDALVNLEEETASLESTLVAEIEPTEVIAVETEPTVDAPANEAVVQPDIPTPTPVASSSSLTRSVTLLISAVVFLGGLLFIAVYLFRRIR